jgi:hypothetical protein
MSFFEDLMSPLGKEHCMYFYYLGYISIILIIVTLIIAIASVYRKNYRIFGLTISYFITLVLMYYISRLNYSVCLGAFK